MQPLTNTDDMAPPPADEYYADVPGVMADDELDALIRAQTEAIANETEPPPDWHIDSLPLAEWAMAKLAEHDATDARLRAQRDAQVERAQDWYVRTSKGVLRRAAHLRAHLEDWALRVRETTGTKTVILPNGEIPTRKGADAAVEIADQAAVTEWALENAAQVVTTTHKVNVTDLRRVAVVVGDRVVTVRDAPGVEPGQIVPGAAVRPPGEITADAKPY